MNQVLPNWTQGLGQVDKQINITAADPLVNLQQNWTIQGGFVSAADWPAEMLLSTWSLQSTWLVILAGLGPKWQFKLNVYISKICTHLVCTPYERRFSCQSQTDSTDNAWLSCSIGSHYHVQMGSWKHFTIIICSERKHHFRLLDQKN